MTSKNGLPYILNSNPQYNSICNELILISKIKNPINNNIKKFKGYREISLKCTSGGVKKGINIPYYYALKKNIKINEKKTTTNPININFNTELREQQVPPFTAALNTLKEEGACVLSAKTGSGKTVKSIKLIAELKVKTLIIVNKEFLLNQWIERIKQFTDITKVGILQGNKVETDYPIVIGMLQSIALKNYPYEVLSSFDFIIYDEVHNLAGDVFSNALFYIGKKRYSLGLSATPERLDGLENIYLWHLNKVLDFRSTISTDKYPIIKTITLNYESIPENHTLYNGTTNSQKMLTDLVNNKVRNKLICDLVVDLCLNNSNRKVLLISSRREHIQNLKKGITERSINSTITSGMYMGGMKNKELAISAEKDIIIGSISVIKEGFDVPDLNTLVIATPLSEVTQLVGRIFRKNHTTINPLIIDLFDNYSMYIPQYYKRNRIYNKVLERNIKKKEFYTITNTEYIKTTTENTSSVDILNEKLESFSFVDLV